MVGCAKVQALATWGSCHALLCCVTAPWLQTQYLRTVKRLDWCCIEGHWSGNVIRDLAEVVDLLYGLIDP